MDKKILIATDGSIHAQNALSYAAGVFKSSTDTIFCLLNVQPIISRYLMDESRTDPEAYKELQKIMHRNATQSENLLYAAKQHLVHKGISESRIKTVSQPRMLGQSKDILEYAHRHLYDTLVLGRRGLSRVQKVFMGSTSAKLMEHGAALPLWIIDGDVSLKRVLVALDASYDAERMVDYLATMIGNHPDVRISAYHIRLDASSLEGDSGDIAPSLAKLVAKSEEKWRSQIWPEALERLTAAGLKTEQIELISVNRKGRMGKMILEQADSGHYDTVVIGRSGVGKAFYFGRVARYVSERITGRALWLIG